MVPFETSECGNHHGALGFSIHCLYYSFILLQSFEVMGHPLSFGKFEIFPEFDMVTKSQLVTQPKQVKNKVAENKL